MPPETVSDMQIPPVAAEFVASLVEDFVQRAKEYLGDTLERGELAILHCAARELCHVTLQAAHDSSDVDEVQVVLLSGRLYNELHP